MSERTRGFVYAHGHRVYGTIEPIQLDDVVTGRYVRPFKAEGKWAFILAPNTAAVQPEEATV